MWAELAAPAGSCESPGRFPPPGAASPAAQRLWGRGGESSLRPPGPAAGEQRGLQAAGSRRSRPADATKNTCFFLLIHAVICGAVLFAGASASVAVHLLWFWWGKEEIVGRRHEGREEPPRTSIFCWSWRDRSCGSPLWAVGLGHSYRPGTALGRCKEKPMAVPRSWTRETLNS